MASRLRICARCPAKMPGGGGLTATVIGCSSETRASRPRGRFSRHGVMVLQHWVLTIETCIVTTACRGRLELGRAREALAAYRAGDVQVVTKLDRLARSLRDGQSIADGLTEKGVALNLGGAVYNPADRSAGSSSASSEWWLSSRPTSFGPAPVRVWRSPRLPASSAAASPSSPRRRRSIWCSCTAPAPTLRATSEGSSACPFDGLPCHAPCG
jgi:hypothetical protein